MLSRARCPTTGLSGQRATGASRTRSGLVGKTPLSGEAAPLVMRRRLMLKVNRFSVGADAPLPPPRLSRCRGSGRVQKSERISVCIPTLNEAASIGPIVHCVREQLMARVPLVDEILVIDSESTDDTCASARRTGATVLRSAEIAAGTGTHSVFSGWRYREFPRRFRDRFAGAIAHPAGCGLREGLLSLLCYLEN